MAATTNGAAVAPAPLSRLRVRAGVAAALLALALGGAGCGDSDDGGESAGASGGGGTGGASAAMSPEQQIEQAYARFTDAMSADDPKAACAALTPEERQRLATQGEASCVTVLGNFTKGVDARGGTTRFLKFDIDGGAAVTRARVAGGQGRVVTLKFEKLGGEWKLAGDEE